MAVGVDVGGTKIAAGLVAADGTVLHTRRVTTPAQDPEALAALIAQAVQALCRQHGLDGLPIGVGAAGMIDRAGVVRYAPNISWRDFPLRDRLMSAIGAPVTVENDANAAAWGEYRAGVARAAGNSMVMLTLGTGVGGGLVLEDRLMRGFWGLGAEFGHILVAEGGALCPCGNRGCVEALASGNAIGRMAREALAQGKVIEESLLHHGEPTGQAVTEAAQAGDEAAREILATAGFWLGVGIASLINALDPELVVIGGGAAQAGDLILEPARAAAVDRIMGREHRPVPPIVLATLGNSAGIVGAALLALEASA